jgi:hypothetical protein
LSLYFCGRRGVGNIAVRVAALVAASSGAGTSVVASIKGTPCEGEEGRRFCGPYMPQQRKVSATQKKPPPRQLALRGSREPPRDLRGVLLRHPRVRQHRHPEQVHDRSLLWCVLLCVCSCLRAFGCVARFWSAKEKEKSLFSIFESHSPSFFYEDF